MLAFEVIYIARCGNGIKTKWKAFLCFRLFKHFICLQLFSPIQTRKLQFIRCVRKGTQKKKLLYESIQLTSTYTVFLTVFESSQFISSCTKIDKLISINDRMLVTVSIQYIFILSILSILFLLIFLLLHSLNSSFTYTYTYIKWNINYIHFVCLCLFSSLLNNFKMIKRKKNEEKSLIQNQFIQKSYTVCS